MPNVLMAAFAVACWIALGVFSLGRHQNAGWVAMLADRNNVKQRWIAPVALIVCIACGPFQSLGSQIAARLLLVLYRGN